MQRLQQLQLASLRKPRTSELRPVEIAFNARVFAEEQFLIQPFKIEGKVESSSHSPIPEFGAPQIHFECLHHSDAVNREFFLCDATLLDSREAVSSRPVLGGVLGAPVECARLERLKCSIRIAEVIESQFLEVVGPDVDQ